MTPPLPTRNDAYGFHGTLRCMGQDPDAGWAHAMAAIARATGGTPEAVRDFLDSRMGRQFADEVANQLVPGRALGPAIDAAIATHQRWRIDRRTEAQHGIPAGLPYLTGWVAQFDILAETQA